MTRTLALAAVCIAALALPATAEPVPALKSTPCVGVPLERFERDAPTGTVRYDVRVDMAQPFVVLWPRAMPLAQPASSAAPDAVSVYDRPGQKLIVAYRAGECVLAVLTMPRAVLRRMVAGALGETA